MQRALDRRVDVVTKQTINDSRYAEIAAAEAVNVF
jgi:hypothetical protein